MSDVTTGTGSDGGRRGRRPILHGGEVTKKKSNAENDDSATTEEPPKPTGKKIGGARNFLKKEEVAIAGDNVHEPDRNIGDIAALQGPYGTANHQLGPRNLQDLAAQPGWRRFWISLTEHQWDEWNKMPDVKLSSFCLTCWQNHNTEYCYTSPRYQAKWDSSVWCTACRNSEEDCKFMVSYRIHPDGDRTSSVVCHPTMREIVGYWDAAQNTPLAVATRTEATELQPPYRLPLVTLADQPIRPAPSMNLRPVVAKEDHRETQSEYLYNPGSFEIYDVSSRPFWETHTCHTLPYRHYDLDPRFYRGPQPLPSGMKRMKDDDDNGEEKKD